MPPRNPGFQAFTLKFNGIAHQLITDITVMPAFNPPNPPPNLPRVQTKALWDTGATRSVISPHVVKALGLSPVGTIKVRHAGGMSDSPTYMVNFALPNRVGVAGLQVSEFPGQQGACEVLIGMDVLRHGDLSLTNAGGRTCMSFRMPSLREIDFVQEHDRQLFGAVGRNEACPCGATHPDGRPKKFKDCHQPTLRG